MKIEELQIVKVTQSVATGIKCDVCGNINNDPNSESFYSFVRHHSDWGNNSIDSFEDFDVCSLHCYMIQLKKSLKEMDNYKGTAEIDHKPFVFVEKMVSDYFSKP